MKWHDSIFVTDIETHPAEKLEGPDIHGVTIQWLISKDIGAPNFEMRYFTLEVGGYTPFHQHPWEHESFVLKGTGVLHTEHGDIPLEPGKALFIPPMIKHQFRNTGKEELHFICVIPKRLD